MTRRPAGSEAAGWLSRFESFEVVGSTNDIVGAWLREGTAEVCVALADVQSDGRGRNGRSWTQPSGAGLLLSAGFQPSWLEIRHLWRLGAVVSVAMAEAGEGAAGLPAGTISLKWPNDLVWLDRSTGEVRKLGGTLGETDGIGTVDPKAVIGIGFNVDWARGRFPPELAGSMTSLSALASALGSSGPVDREAVLEGFLDRLRVGIEALRLGEFASEAWRRRQLTNGLAVMLDQLDGSTETVMAEDVDTETGALLVRELDQPVAVGANVGAGDQERGRERGHEESGERLRSVVAGEIRHLRVGGAG